MSEIKAIKKYVCGECDTTHDYDFQAEQCCPPTICVVYECPTCDETHDDEPTAISCCEAIRDGSETLSLRISPLELEKHGQQRLAL